MNQISHHAKGERRWRATDGYAWLDSFNDRGNAFAAGRYSIGGSVELIDVDHEEAELYRCAEAIFADQRIAAPATRTMCAHDAAHGHGDGGRRWHDPGDIWTRNYAFHELGRGVLCVYLGARMVCGMQLTGRETCRRSHAAEQARMHDIIVQHEKRLESRSDHVQTSEPGMSRLHS